jgi:hypothetical protein
MRETLPNLVERIDDPLFARTNVIPWSCPVPSFGDLSNSVVATLGLNPSNREFVDDDGDELDGEARRLHTLNSLELSRWSQVKTKHLELIEESCRDYFHKNPYDGWFKALENIITGANFSYYGKGANACHLDLIPYATASKWTELSPKQRTTLLEFAGDTLGLLLRNSPIRILILNGRSVAINLERIAAVTFEKREMKGWTLPRRSDVGVAGFAYTGVITQILGVELARPVVVLGFNHNIQSSFGVTTQVKLAIKQWIAQTAKGVLACGHGKSNARRRSMQA